MPNKRTFLFQGTPTKMSRNYVKVFCRSDGVNHDIITVFKSFSDATDVRSVVKRSNSVYEDQEETFRRRLSLIEDRDNSADINLDRSDELHHDISLLHRCSENGITAICDRVLQSQGSFFGGEPIRIVHMSDTGNMLEAGKGKEHLPPGTMLIHSGNFTQEGKYEEFVQFDNWLRSVADTYHYRIVVLGEKDTIKYRDNWDQMKSLLRGATHVLCDTTEVICGLRIRGCPWRRETKVHSLLPYRRRNTYDDIQDVDIVVSHEPSYGRLDSPDSGKTHTGNRDLVEAIKQAQPGLHLHGGLVAGRGVYFPVSRSPLTVNSCMCDPTYSCLYAAPHVIKASPVDIAVAGVQTWVFAMDELFHS